MFIKTSDAQIITIERHILEERLICPRRPAS
jgi:hypothetical protein